MKDHLLKEINTSTQSHGYDNILSSMYNKLDLHNVIRIEKIIGDKLEFKVYIVFDKIKLGLMNYHESIK